MSESVFIRLFAGVPFDGVDMIPLIPFGQWLLSIGLFLLAAGYDMEREKKVELFSKYRYGSVSIWWKKQFLKKTAFGMRAAVFFLFFALLCDFAMGNERLLSIELVVKISVLWFFHSISMAVFFAVLSLFPIRRFAPMALFLLEGVTFLIGCRIREFSFLMYGTWGMYERSSFCETGGFLAGAVIAVEILMLAAGFLIGWGYLKLA